MDSAREDTGGDLGPGPDEPVTIAPMDPVVRDILEVALSEFANYGFEGTRIEAIAARMATSKRMIYYHFGSKEKLYEAVLNYAYDLVRSGREQAGDIDALPPLEALRALAGSAFDSFNRHPDFIRLTLQENLRGAPVVSTSQAIRRINQGNMAGIERQLRRGQAEGSMRLDLEPIDVYITFVGLCSYHVAARPAYKALFDTDFFSPQVRARRRASICEALLRYVRA